LRTPCKGWDSGLVSPQIATNTVVTRDELLDFARPRHHAVVITRRADGSPQASPVTCGVDEAGRIVVATYPSRAKTRNARRDPRGERRGLAGWFRGPVGAAGRRRRGPGWAGSGRAADLLLPGDRRRAPGLG